MLNGDNKIDVCVNQKFFFKQKGVANKCNSLETNTLNKWAHLESNQAPTDYESVALTE